MGAGGPFRQGRRRDALNQQGDTDMEFILALLVAISTLAALDAAALTWGIDSREVLPDDRAR